MLKYNSCFIMGKTCKHANVFGDCKAKKKNCDTETPFILNDDYSEDIDNFLNFDLFEEGDELC